MMKRTNHYTNVFIYDQATGEIIAGAMMPFSDVEGYVARLPEGQNGLDMGPAHPPSKNLEFTDKANPRVDGLRQRGRV